MPHTSPSRRSPARRPFALSFAKPAAWFASIAILALTGACATQVGTPGQPVAKAEPPVQTARGAAPQDRPVRREKLAGRVAPSDSEIPRTMGESNTFNPTPIAIRARRPASTTAFVRDETDRPMPVGALPDSSRFASWWNRQAPSRSVTDLVAFSSAPFPYDGLTPSGESFLNVASGGARGRRTFRGGVLWEDRTFNDNRVLLHIPEHFDPSRPAVMVVFFHGWGATLSRDVLERQQVAAQVSASGANAVLVAPQFASDARDSSAGRFWTDGGFRRFLGEAAKQMASKYGDASSERTFAKMPIVMVAYSGGFLPAAYSLEDAAVTNRVRGVVLLDAAYGSLDTFADWIAKEPSGFLLSSFTRYTQWRNKQLRDMLAARGVPVSTRLAGNSLPSGGTFLATDSSSNHTDFVNRAWDDDPIKIILASMPGVAGRDSDAVASIGDRRSGGKHAVAAVR